MRDNLLNQALVKVYNQMMNSFQSLFQASVKTLAALGNNAFMAAAS